MDSPIIYIERYTPPVPESPGLEGECWLASGFATFEEHQLFAFLQSGSKKSPDIGKWFPNLKPYPDGHFNIEVGVILPDILPAVDGKHEYTLQVGGDGLPEKTLAISNFISSLHYRVNGVNYVALIHRSRLAQHRQHEQTKELAEAHEHKARTLVATRSEIKGTEAEEALDNHLADCLTDFLKYLNRLREGFTSIGGQNDYYDPIYTARSFETFLFIIKGIADEELGHGRIALHMDTIRQNPYPVPPELVERLKAVLSGGRLDESEVLFHAARIYLNAGSLDYSLLLAVIAAESATRRLIYGRWKQLGVSQNKIDETNKNIDFSYLSNVELMVIAPEGNKPKSEMLGLLNRARSLRNDHMHEAKRITDVAEVNRLYNGIADYLNYLTKLATLWPDPPITPIAT